MKTATFFIATSVLIATSGVAFAGDAANSSAPLNNPGGQIHLSPATHQPAAASGAASSVVGKNELKKSAQRHVVPASPVAKPALPVNAGQPHGAAIIGGTATKTSHENGVINGTERRRFP